MNKYKQRLHTYTSNLSTLNKEKYQRCEFPLIIKKKLMESSLGVEKYDELCMPTNMYNYIVLTRYTNNPILREIRTLILWNLKKNRHIRGNEYLCQIADDFIDMLDETHMFNN